MPACNCCRYHEAPPNGCLRATHGTDRHCWLCGTALGRAFDADVIYCPTCTEHQQANGYIDCFVELVPWVGPMQANATRLRAKLPLYAAYLSQNEARSAELMQRYGKKGR